MNLLTYDYFTALDKVANHHAPLEPPPGALDASARTLNIEATVDYYLTLGAAPNKLIVGVPTYGRSFTLERPLEGEEAAIGGLGARADAPGDEGPATREKGHLAYYEICQRVDSENWRKERPAPNALGPVAHSGKQWVSYDDVESAVMKAKYVIRNKLGGVMVWTLDNDDFRAACPSSNNVHSPLITAMRDTIIASVTKNAPLPLQTSTSTTTTTTTPPPPPPSIAEDVHNNELNAAGSAGSESSLIRNLAESAARQPAVTTPEPNAAFTCKDEGFFPNPKDCRTYFWCLDSGPANLGIVAHSFTCPSGLLFNTATEGCDYPDKVACKNKKPAKQSAASTSTTTTTTMRPSTTSAARTPSPPALDRSRLVVKKSRKPSSTTTTSTTTSTTTTTTTTPPPPSPQASTASTALPNTNDINELVAHMLQNPNFASVISSQFKAKQEASQAGSGDLTNDNVAPSSQDLSAGMPAQNSKQAHELLQLLNLIQSLGGVEKIAPYLASQAAPGGSESEVAREEAEAEDGAAALGTRHTRRPLSPNDAAESSPAATSGGDSAPSNEPSIALSEEVLANLAQLESLFAYTQPAGGAAASEQPTMAPRQSLVESQQFTASDAKPAPLTNQRFAPPTQPLIRVRVPAQEIRPMRHQHQQQHQHHQHQQQRQPQQQHQKPVQRGPSRSQYAGFHDENSGQFLPYLEGDLRQVAPRQHQPLQNQQQAHSQQGMQTRVQLQPQAPLQLAAPAAVPAQRQRRPPNRERGQRANNEVPRAQSAAPTRSLVLLSNGPPSTDGAGGSFLDGLSLSDADLEARLRQLEAGTESPADGEDAAPPAVSTSTSASANTGSGTGTTESSARGTARQSSELAGPRRADRQLALTTAASVSEAPATSAAPVLGTGALLDLSGPGVSVEPSNGLLSCNRRGVFAHPASCGQFIVCAPQSRAGRALRPFEHHCPAEHIFHDSWGRCRPKSVQSDWSKLCAAHGLR